MTRTWKTRHPKSYLDLSVPYVQGSKQLDTQDLIIEFMLNALRLYETITFDLFTQRTGLTQDKIAASLRQAEDRGLMITTDTGFATTPLGKLHLNELLLLFS